MSQRQSNLFSAEDFVKIFRSFKSVNFTAYDFDSIKLALVQYIKEQFPEDFNDYIESSEFISIVELLAYLSTSLAFRTELNSRENFLDTAERRESIIRLARMLSYNPKRNIPARGLLKITAIKTNEPISDSLGRSLQDAVVYWNDANNPDGFEQFTTILNAALIRNNPFGRPLKSSDIDGIPTDLYQMNNASLTSLVYNVSFPFVDGSHYVNVVNADLTATGTVTERHPNSDNAFHMVYRNDGNGQESANTGFFLHFRQGELKNKDYRFDFPLENRVVEIDDTNINEYDVYVQEINDDGTVVDQWNRIPAMTGNNIIFNNTDLDVRKIYSVITQPNDAISIKFADGNFGEIPKGIFRVWYRTSANKFINIRPENASNIQLPIAYKGRDGRDYRVIVYLNLEGTVNNSAPSETSEDIKLRAPQVFYTQNRMVNAEDYNIFPLSFGNEIEKIRSINRTHSGHSRYIDINDPTGTVQNVILFAEDGAIYKDYEPEQIEIEVGPTTDYLELVNTRLIEFLRNTRLNNWFYDRYYKQFIATYPTVVNYAGAGENIRWKTAPDKERNDTGYFLATGTNLSLPADEIFDTAINTYLFNFVHIKEGAYARFINPSNPLEIKTVSIKSVSNNGLPLNVGVTTTGPIVLSSEIPDKWKLLDIIPSFNRSFSESTSNSVIDASSVIRLDSTIAYAMKTIKGSFGLGYDGLDRSWYIIPENTVLVGDLSLDNYRLARTPVNDTSWFVYVEYISGKESGSGVDKYRFTTRGTRYVFESLKEVRFFYSPEQKSIDIQTGRQAQDEIVILDMNKRQLKETWLFTNSKWINNQGLESANATTILLNSRTDNASNTTVKLLALNAATSDNIYDYVEVESGPSTYTVGTGTITISLDYIASLSNHRIDVTYSTPVALDQSITWNIDKSFILEDGHLDQTKVEVKPSDTDKDNVPDLPFGFETFVNEASDRVFFEQYTDFDGYEYFRPWKTSYTVVENLQNISFVQVAINSLSLEDMGFLIFNTMSNVDEFLEYLAQNTSDISEDFLSAISGKPLYVMTVNDSSGPYGLFYTMPDVTLESLPNTTSADLVRNTDHYARVGRSFALNTNDVQTPLWFKWKHYAPRLNRIDPSVSNIIDMYILTKQYYNTVNLWKGEGKSIDDFPEAPTSDDLRTQFNELSSYKMISDQIIFKPAKFKVLFGKQADAVVRAKFKVVKIPTITMSDNEVKSRVVSAIDRYFDIVNWEYGESFYYTELCAYIHQELASLIATVVIVPSKAESQFGDLFQIKAEPDQLFLSTATVLDVEIVESLTDTNLRSR